MGYTKTYRGVRPEVNLLKKLRIEICCIGAIIHEEVAALLRVLPQVEDLGQDGYVILRALEAEVGVHGEASSRLAIVVAWLKG